MGTARKVNPLRSGDLLIEVASAAQSAQISRLCTLVDRPVTISPHRTLNTCKGVIRCRELVGCDEAETLTELSSQGVTAIYNVTVKDGPDGRRPTNTFFVTFRLPTIPKHLKVGYIRVPVTAYIPAPLRCFKCQKFGHGLKVCKGDTTCAKCGQIDHDTDNCSNEVKCRNCAGKHPAFSKECPKWKLEQKVQQIKVERGISFAEARKIITAESECKPTACGRTAAAVVASGSTSLRPATRSVITQTDLTWPWNQDKPCHVPVVIPHVQSTQTASPSLPINTSSPSQSTSETRSRPGSRAQRTGAASGGKSSHDRSLSTSASERGENFKKPHGKPPNKGKGSRKPLNRPLNSGISTSNTYDALDPIDNTMVVGDDSESDSDSQSPFTKNDPNRAVEPT